MSFFKPKFVLLALMCALVCASLASGCTGGAFSANDAAVAGSAADSGGSNSSAGTGTGKAGSNVGTGGGTGKACGGPEDCNDGDACTTDRCNADGTCDAAPKCAGSQRCCQGDCAQCCTNADCDDGVSCTDNTCFSGQCMFVPNDTLCDKTQYCSTKDGCRAKQTCGIVPGEAKTICDDGSACTTDSCVGNFCQHDFCPDAAANLCCEGVGCAACCNDSQCDTDNDPCTVGSCKDGKCSLVPLCAGQDCCPSADHKTATCGACCSATDCDDSIGCTDDKCGGGQCSNTPNNNHCDPGYLCDPAAKSCTKAADCSSPGDCKPTACQINARCDSGACHFDTCATKNLKCCDGGAAGTAGCAVCCGNAECADTVDCTTDTCTANGCTHTANTGACAQGLVCDLQHGCVACQNDGQCDDGLSCTKDVCNNDPTTGTFTCSHTSTCAAAQYCTANGCSSCVSDSDCQGGVITTNIAQPPIGGGSCAVKKCVKGACQDLTLTCIGEQRCCPPFGCAIACGIQVN